MSKRKLYIICLLLAVCIAGCTPAQQGETTGEQPPTTQPVMRTVYIPVSESWTYADGSTQTFTYVYDENDHLIEINRGVGPDGNEIKCAATCDELGRVLQIKHGGFGGYTESYTYDECGRIHTYTSRGTQRIYTYDAAGNLVKIETPLDEFRSQVTEYVYQDDRVVEVTQFAANGDVMGKTTYEYDSKDRLLCETMGAEDTVPTQIHYAYSEDGLTETKTWGDEMQVRVYDLHGNVISLEYVGTYVSHKCVYTYRPIEVPADLEWEPYRAPIAH